MSGQDLMLDLQAKVTLLDKTLQPLGKRGSDYAQAEQDYRIALAKNIAVERADGTPVTIISDICRGDKEIALAKFQRDVAEITYDAAKEACNVYKLQLRLLENQIDREYRG